MPVWVGTAGIWLAQALRARGELRARPGARQLFGGEMAAVTLC